MQRNVPLPGYGAPDLPRRWVRPRSARSEVQGSAQLAGPRFAWYSRSSPSRASPRAVGVVGDEPEGAVRSRNSIADAPVGAGEEGGRITPVGMDGPDPFPPQCSHEEGVAHDRQPARARVGRAPLRDRIGEPRVAGHPLDDRPAVVRARSDDVELVPGVLSELARPHPTLRVPADALRVAVAETPDERAERVSLGHAAGRGHAEDLAVQRCPILRTVALPGIPGGRVEHPVRPEGEPPSVVVAGLRDAREDRLGFPEAQRTGGAGQRHPHDAVAVGCREVGVHPTALGQEREPEEPAFPVRLDVVDLGGHPGSPAGEQFADVGLVALADERRAVRKAEDRPRSVEVGGDHRGIADRFDGLQQRPCVGAAGRAGCRGRADRRDLRRGGAGHEERHGRRTQGRRDRGPHRASVRKARRRRAPPRRHFYRLHPYSLREEGSGDHPCRQAVLSETT